MGTLGCAVCVHRCTWAWGGLPPPSLTWMPVLTWFDVKNKQTLVLPVCLKHKARLMSISAVEMHVMKLRLFIRKEI